ncbi:MAG: BolA family transcriptional regulator [Alphaproteobacteria bacterium]|nr:BolA family transcriptional regulator [Alphaproteobacteria bacterium]
MSVAEALRAKLEAAFAPAELDIEDQSARHGGGHAGHREGGETHFRVRIVARAFEGRSRVERERAVHALLKDEFAAGLHALSLEIRTPGEAAR